MNSWYASLSHKPEKCHTSVLLFGDIESQTQVIQVTANEVMKHLSSKGNWLD